MNALKSALSRVGGASTRCVASTLSQPAQTSILSKARFSTNPFAKPQAWLTNLKGDRLDVLDLPPALFTEEIRPDIVHRVVVYQLAKRRQGTHKTKSRTEVSGSTRKLYRQKGSGRARVADVRQPQRVGGYTVHGPVPRSHAISLPKQVRKRGLRIALTSKFQQGKLVIVDNLDLQEGKTRVLRELLNGPLAETWGTRGQLCLDGETRDRNFELASRSLNIDYLPQLGANVYDVLRKDTLVLTLDCLEHLAVLLDPVGTKASFEDGPKFPDQWPLSSPDQSATL